MGRQQLTSLIVGSHFVPPAKALLAALPAGTALLLRAEPENPYDSDAILVLLPEGVAEELMALPGLEDALMEQGATVEQVLSTLPLILGHIAASGGKPLAKAASAEAGLPSLTGTIEWKEALEVQAACIAGMEAGGHDLMSHTYDCSLAFAPSGLPLVTASWEEN